jgi:glucokinase
MTIQLIAWDLGATNCRAGLIEYEPSSQLFNCLKSAAIKLMETTSLEDLIAQLEEQLATSFTDVQAICIGAAGHYRDGQLFHANAYPYSMDFSDLAKKRCWPPFAVIHDYATIVCSTFTDYLTKQANIKRLNHCDIKTYSRRIALGIGTGLGLKDGILFPNGDFWLGHNEAGHIGITSPPHADDQHLTMHQEIMRFLKIKSDRHQTPITFESLLAGKGTVNLHEFFYPDMLHLTPEAVGIRMRNGQAEEMVDAFAWYIGLFIGTVQLMFMPEGGIWITGGVVMNHLDVFERPDFINGIESFPAYLTQRKNYPLGILINHEHALIGGGYYASKRLACA